jgi:hypothetical protein
VNRLARDLAAYLDGDGPAPRAGDYALPWYLFIPVVVPLGIPLLTLGGILPVAVGFGLAGVIFAIVWKDNWPTAVRVAASLGLALVGYLAVFAFIVLTLILNTLGGGAGGPQGPAQPTLWQPPGPLPQMRPAPGDPDNPGQPPFPVDPKLPGPDPLVYLTDMQEFDVKPGPWPLGKNGTVGSPDRKPIVVNGRKSPKGLGLHPPSGPDHAHVRYALGKMAQVFKAAVAFNDSQEGGPGPIQFLVLGDGKELWHSQVLRRRDQAEECVVDVSGVDVLELRVRGEGSTFGSHAVWVEPRLFKSRADADWEAPLNLPPSRPAAPPGERAVWEETGSDRTIALAFAPDSAILAVGHWGDMLRLWDVAGSTQRAHLATHQGAVFALAFSKDGKRLATGGANGKVLLRDPASGEELRGFQVLHTQARDQNRVTALGFAPDGKVLAVGIEPGGSSNGEVHLWDLRADRERAVLPNCGETVVGLVFAPEGALVVLMPASVKVCDAATLQVRREFKAREWKEQIITSAVSPDGRTLATLDADGKLKLWRLSTGVCLQTWPVKADVIRESYFPLVFSPDGKVLALGGRGPNLYLWDAQTGRELKVVALGGSAGFVDRVIFSPDGQLLALHSTTGNRIFEVAPLLGNRK